MIVLRPLVRLLARLGLRWLLAGALARFVARRVGRSTIERATGELETRAEKLPAPVARVVTSLPTEAKQIGGSALVAGRAAKVAATTTRRAGAVARTTSRRASTGVGAARGAAGAVRGAIDQVRTETEASGRRLRAQYLSATVGPDAATDSLLDLRPQTIEGPPGGAPVSRPSRGLDDDPHEFVPTPVGRGRRRARRRRRQPAVNRRLRTYHPPAKPWDH